MTDSSALIAQLRGAALGSLSPADARPVEAWLDAGLAPGQLHEVYTAEAEDGASGAGFAVALTLAAHALPLLWLRTEACERPAGRLHATGLAELGLSPDSLLLGVVDDEPALLRAAADAARCSGLGTLVVEAWGRAAGLDLTATRRLMLAAEASGVTVIALRVAAQPTPSAAATRWGVTAVPSAALEADAPGLPAFDVELLRRRGGPAGLAWRVEWDRDAQSFRGTPLSGARLPMGSDRAAEGRSPASVRRTG